MKEAIITLFIGLVFFLTACAPEESAVANIEMKSQEELSAMTDSYTREDYRQVMSHIMQEAKSFEAGVVLEKWIIRTLAEEALYYEEDLSEEEVLEISRERLAEDLAWKNIASAKYGIIVGRDELDEYINNITTLYESPLQMAYADILGLTVEQLNHEFDEDVYEKNLMWEKLKPELEKAYETSDQNELVERFNKEVNNEINR